MKSKANFLCAKGIKKEMRDSWEGKTAICYTTVTLHICNMLHPALFLILLRKRSPLPVGMDVRRQLVMKRIVDPG